MCMTSLLLLAPVPALVCFLLVFFFFSFVVVVCLASFEFKAGCDRNGNTTGSFSDSSLTAAVQRWGGQLQLPPLHGQRIIYSGFLMPTVKFSRSQFDSTFDWGGSSAFLLSVSLRAIKSFTLSFCFWGIFILISCSCN